MPPLGGLRIVGFSAMKRSEINSLVRAAQTCFLTHGWTLPPVPKWDVTDFGLGRIRESGLVLINLCEEPEYCEKLMYARKGMLTPAHCHHQKKEDIICRWGVLHLRFWASADTAADKRPVAMKLDGVMTEFQAGETLRLVAGSRITITPHIYHEFVPASPECIIGEVSTANDDLNDNFFINPDIGRFPDIEEDEPPLVRLVSDRS